MKIILSLIIGGALVVSGFGQTRNVLVGTNSAVVQPTNFWSADAVNARAGLGLGSAATNPATAFQPSSLNLSNLAANNAGSLTNLNATNIVGILSVAQGGTGSTNASDARTALGLGTAATNPATAFQSSSTALSNLATGNGGALSNLQATNLVGIIPSSNIATVNLTNIGGTLPVTQGGTGATNAANARQNLGSTTVGDAVFIATNEAAARAAIGALSVNGNAINLTNFPTVGLASNVSGVVAITNGGSGATNAGGARTNLELGVTNAVQFGSLVVTNAGASATLTVNGGLIFAGSPAATAAALTRTNLGLGFSGLTNTNAETFRTSIGLGWSALTNTSSSGFQASLFGANTNPVLVNTNGEVVSPTNFWQVAPITTTFIESQPVTNSSTNITAARFLHIHSLATNIANVTNTINLPTNGATFNGDIALVVHQGPTNSMTKVRTAGSTNDLVTMTRFDEAVEFVYYNGVWEFNHNLSFIEPIYFSGTNAAANAAASRTNLGLGAGEAASTALRTSLSSGDAATMFISDSAGGLYDQANDEWALTANDNEFQFNGTNRASEFRNALGLSATWLTNTNVTNFRTAIGLGATNDVEFNSLNAQSGLSVRQGTNFFFSTGDDVAEFFVPVNIYSANGLDFVGTNAATARGQTRTNLGLGATNSVAFSNVVLSGGTQTNPAIQFGNTNAGLFGGGGPPTVRVSVSGSNTVTFYETSTEIENSTTIKTNLTVNGFVNFSTNHTNSNPVTNNQIQKFLEVRIGTNQFWLPLYK